MSDLTMSMFGDLKSLREAQHKQARERALAEADRRWPPGNQYAGEREREADSLTVQYFREITGATP